MRFSRFVVAFVFALGCTERPDTAEDVYERASVHAASATAHLQKGMLLDADREMEAAAATIRRWATAPQSSGQADQAVAGQPLSDWLRYWRERAEVVAEMHFDEVLARIEEGALKTSDVEAFVKKYSTGVLATRWEESRPAAAEASAKRVAGAWRFRCVERVDPSTLSGRSPVPGLTCSTLLDLLRERSGVEVLDEPAPEEGMDDTAAGEVRVRWWADWLRIPDTKGDWRLPRTLTAAIEVNGDSGWAGSHVLQVELATPRVEALRKRSRGELAQTERALFATVRERWSEQIDDWGAFHGTPPDFDERSAGALPDPNTPRPRRGGAR